MFKRGCNKCGEEWYIGNPSTCKCQTNDQPKREWVSLTDDEADMFDKRLSGSGVSRVIEAVLKGRNY